MQGGRGEEVEDNSGNDNGDKNKDERGRGDTQDKRSVKGLDWELLRRVKAGEDVNSILEEREKKRENGEDEEVEEEKEGAEESKETTENVEGMDEEFERVFEEKGRDVATAAPIGEKDKKRRGIWRLLRRRDDLGMRF